LVVINIAFVNTNNVTPAGSTVDTSVVACRIARFSSRRVRNDV